MSGGANYTPANRNDKPLEFGNNKKVNEILNWLFNYSVTNRNSFDFTFFQFVLCELSIYWKSEPEEKSVYWNYVLNESTNYFVETRQEIHPLENILQQIRLRAEYPDIFKPPEPADQQQTVPREALDDALATKTADVIAALDAGGDQAATVRALFAAAGRIVETANSPQNPWLNEVDPPAQSSAGPLGQATTEAVAQFAAAASEPVPAVAPRLWSERDKKTEKNPAEFIRTVYASCMANLGQHHLWTLDRGLYRRYVDWKDEPKELVDGKVKPCDQLVEFGSSNRLSDEERGRRAREQSNTTKAKKRAQQKAICDTPPHFDR